VRTWAYAVKAGDSLTDKWPLEAFENGLYHLRVYGPNGFYREFKGDENDPLVDVVCGYERKGKAFTGNISLQLNNTDHTHVYTVEITDHAYKSGDHKKVLAAGVKSSMVLDLSKSYGWYDFSVRISGSRTFERRYAGHVENGKVTFSDPAMGRVKL